MSCKIAVAWTCQLLDSRCWEFAQRCVYDMARWGNTVACFTSQEVVTEAGVWTNQFEHQSSEWMYSFSYQWFRWRKCSVLAIWLRLFVCKACSSHQHIYIYDYCVCADMEPFSESLGIMRICSAIVTVGKSKCQWAVLKVSCWPRGLGDVSKL